MERTNRANDIKVENKGRGSLSRSVNLSKESSIKNHLGDLRYPNSKYVNRTKDWSFVNQKMVIKPDPNKFIFNTNKNMAFFQQAENQNDDVIIITNDNINKNYNSFNNNNIYDSNKIGLNKDEKGDEKDNYNILREKIDEDYDNNINNINKLITLDAEIKKDKIRNSSKKKEDNNSTIKDFNNNKNNDNYYNNDNNEDNEQKFIENINIDDNNNTHLLNLLLSEVRALNNKQVSLLDLVDDIQTKAEEEIDNLNQKVVDLDTVAKDLNHQLFSLKNDGE